MDPVETTKTVLSMAYKLYLFIESTRVVSQTLKELYAETNQLGNICNAVETEMKRFQNREGVEEDQIINLVHQQLAECEKAIHQLEDNLSPIRSEGSNFVAQGYRQVMLQIKEDDIAESRAQIRAHSGNLQISLLLMTLKASYLGPKIVNEMLGEKMNRLERLIEKHGTRNDTPLMQIARKCLGESSTLYEGSVMDGSVAPRSNKSKARTAAWIEDMHDLRLDQLTILESSEVLSEGPSGSIATTDYDNAQESSTVATSRSPYQEDEDLRKRTHKTTLSIGDVPTELNRTTSDPDIYDLGNDTDPHSDFDEIDIDFDAATSSIKTANAYFEKHNYEETHALLEDALKQIRTLPAHKRGLFDLGEMHFRLAICTFHLRSSTEAEEALLSVLDETASNARNLCAASHLLAQCYVRNGKLTLAMTACTTAYKGRRKLFGKEHELCHESLGLLARIHELLGMQPRAKSYFGMIPETDQVRVQSLFETLCPTSDVVATIPSPPVKTDSPEKAEDPDSAHCETARITVISLDRLHTKSFPTVYERYSQSLKSPEQDESKVYLYWDMEYKYNFLYFPEVTASFDWNDSTRTFKLDNNRDNFAQISRSEYLYNAPDGPAITRFQIAPGNEATYLVHESCRGKHAHYGVAWSMIGGLIASASQKGQIHVWDKDTKSLLWWIEDPECLGCVEMSVDGHVLAAATKSGVKIWNARTGEAIHDFSTGGERSSDRMIEFSPKGETVATCDFPRTREVFISSMSDAAPKIWTLSPACTYGQICAISLIGAHRLIVLIASENSNRAALSDTTTKNWTELQGDEYRFKQAGFSDDGRWLVTLMLRPGGAFRSPRWKLCKWDVFDRLNIKI